MPDETPPSFVVTGSYPTRSGNAVHLLIDGEPAFRRLCQTIEAAQHSVWATVTFMWSAFRMPDHRGTALEVLDRAVRRGVDVRLIFWRPDDETAGLRRNAFWGAPEHFDLLRRLQTQVGIRWDRAHPGYCQHQKTWVIDAGHDGQLAFLGGINLNPHSVVTPGHRGEGQNHDVYIELQGAAVADVEHNFVQRWNEASERHFLDGHWGERGNSALEFPTRLPSERGTAMVQIQRTIHASRYKNGQSPINAPPFDIAVGEQTNFQQYLSAVQSARRSIYIENQCLEIPEIVTALRDALERGVEVVMVLPAAPDLVPMTDALPERRALYAARAELGNYEHFALCGIAGLGGDGCRKSVWVHSKLMLIDDQWATVGSANLHRWSMFGNSELNAAIAAPEIVRGFRIALLQEHLASNTSALDDVAALRLFRDVARGNREKLLRGDHVWQGLAVALKISSYGQESQLGF
ncbi:MAG: phosphatidylserine/phosphatidylglycerophosphate/cardiolipin synthase family protein [Pleurocapsa sp. SU_196_0]|nr:phosphatidylserine/phosphatidylglycerophosphate/cardiolipin synthase family protein [Pleurocapsa sp. SU_196_0]